MSGSGIPQRHILWFFSSSGLGIAINYQLFVQRSKKNDLSYFFLIYSFTSSLCTKNSQRLFDFHAYMAILFVDNITPTTNTVMIFVTTKSRTHEFLGSWLLGFLFFFLMFLPFSALNVFLYIFFMCVKNYLFPLLFLLSRIFISIALYASSTSSILYQSRFYQIKIPYLYYSPFISGSHRIQYVQQDL